MGIETTNRVNWEFHTVWWDLTLTTGLAGGGDYRQGELGTETTNRVNWKFQYRVGDLTLGLAVVETTERVNWELKLPIG